jgi:hypothetical protein
MNGQDEGERQLKESIEGTIQKEVTSPLHGVE